MEVAILGSLEVRVDGRAIPLGGPKQRALLTMLVLHANELVSRDRLIDALWGERPPPSVQQSLDTYVSRLRRALGGDRVRRGSGGYVLNIEAGELDLERFESLVRAAREASASGDGERAARMFGDALALWRGPALADVLYEPVASQEAERLEELRLGVLEEWIDIRLGTGESSELVPELEALVREHPLRERLLAQLMLALYRAGRQADALATLQRARRRLRDELGLEPGSELRELERRILQQDPTLDGPRRQRPRVRVRRRWRVVAGFTSLTLAAAAAAGIGLAGGSKDTFRGPGATSNRLLVIDTRSAKLTDATKLAGSPSGVALAAGANWAVDSSAGLVERVDPSSNTVVDRIPVDGEPGSVVSGGGAIWVASTLGGTITRIDPDTDRVTETLRFGGRDLAAVASRGRELWVADATGHSLVVSKRGAPRRTVPLDLRPSAIALGVGVVWVAGTAADGSGTVEKLDARSGEAVATIRVGQGPSAVAVSGEGVWVANGLDGSVSHIDSGAGSVAATIPVGSGPSGIAAGAGSIWVANRYAGTVSEIDPHRNQIVSTIHVGGQPTGLAATSAHVWVAAASRGDTHRGGTLRLLNPAPFPSIDPAFQYSTPLLARLPYDTLVSFQAAAGPVGLQLVPDLAVAVPTPSGGGTTYAFRLRPGIRYSDGRHLRARDFRRAIERLFRLDSPGASLYASVVGAGSCVQHLAACDLSRGIVTDDAARTIIFHLRSPDPDFLLKLTVLGFSVPIPPGTPDRDVGLRAVPGTGPYRIVGSTERQLRLVRNRFFHEWSHAAQPDGKPDAILWRFGLSRQAEAREIEGGRADWTGDLLPGRRLRELQVRSPGLLHENPTFDIQFVPLNTRRPPFDDVRVRRALNYAVDRTKVAHMYGANVATPTCQPLPAGFPGYRRYCPYTLHPRADGRWTAPDLGRARRLVLASGTRGEQIDVWAASDLPGIPRHLPPYVAEVLRSLGYKTRLRLVPFATFSPNMRRGIQLSVDGDWVPDYPAPTAFMPSFFGCHGGDNRKHYVCDPELDREMRSASALQLQDATRAAALWAKIDHQLVDQAVWVPIVNARAIEFVSKRLRNYQYHPVWGFMADQAWVR